MNAPHVSVVVTSYNYGRFLAPCLDSILQQEGAEAEVILIDDGSTDDTAEVAGRYRHRPGFRYLRQNNSGQARAKNAGVRHATGRLIAFLDADDLWEPGKLARQLPLFDNPRTGVVFSRMRQIDQAGALLPPAETLEHLRPRRGKVTSWLFFDNFVPFSSAVVRRECLRSGEPFDPSLRMGIDWDLWLRLSVGWEFDFVDAPLLRYRVGHAGQMSQAREVRQGCTDRIRERFLADHPGLLPPSLIRRALHLSHCSRGYYFAPIDKKKAFFHYRTALKYDKFSLAAYRGILRTLLY